MGLAAVLSSDMGHFSTLGVMQGVSVFRAGEAMAGGLGNRAGRAEDEC